MGSAGWVSPRRLRRRPGPARAVRKARRAAQQQTPICPVAPALASPSALFAHPAQDRAGRSDRAPVGQPQRRKLRRPGGLAQPLARAFAQERDRAPVRGDDLLVLYARRAQRFLHAAAWMHAWTTVVAVAHIQRREGGGHVLFNRRPRNRVGRRFCRARVGGAPGVARNAEARVFHRALFGHGYEFDFGAPRVVRAGTRRAFGDAREELRVARYLRPQRARQRFTRVGDPAFAMRRELDEFRFARRFFAQLFGVRVAVPAVAGVLRVGELGQVDVARVAEEAVVFERVVGDFVAQVVVVAEFFVDFRATEAVVFLKARGRGFFNGRVGEQQDSPGAVVVDRVPADDVVVVAGEHHTAPDRPSSCYAGGGDVGVVVVVHEVFREQPAVVRAGRPRFAFFRARTVLRRGRVVVVLAVADEARLVVVELRVLDRQVPARVRARVAERAGFGVGVVEGRVAVATGADVEGGGRQVVGVELRRC